MLDHRKKRSGCSVTFSVLLAGLAWLAVMLGQRWW